MSVIDRLLAMDGVQAAEPLVESALPLGEQRGDFMLLPPLRSMKFDVTRLQQAPGDYLVTRRPASVTEGALVHGVDPDRFGRVAGRVRRIRGPRRAPRKDLVHRIAEHDEWEEFPDEPVQEQLGQLPPIIPPRQLRTAPVVAKPPVSPRPVAVLPSVSEVRQAVSLEPTGPSLRRTAAPAPLADVKRLSQLGSNAEPVVRRRGPAPQIEAAQEEDSPVLPSDVAESDIPQPPDDAVLASLKGQARVRGSQPPVAPAADKPKRGKARPPDRQLAEPQAPSVPPIASTPAVVATPSAPSTPAQAARGTVSSVAVPSQIHGTQPPSAPARQVRPMLGKREPMVPMGRTGVQRRERDASSPNPARPAAAARPAPPPRGLASTSVPALPAAGPRTVPVPPAIQQVLRGTVGNAPATVRVHEGMQAAQQSDAMNAEAFTRDGEIYLSSDIPLHSRRGQELLAHELTHVVQQQGGMARMPDESSAAGQAHELMARQVEAQVAAPAAELIHRVASTVSAPAAPASAPVGVQRSAAPLVKNSPGMTMGAPVSRPKSGDSDDDDDDQPNSGSSGWGRMKSAGLSWLENQLSEPPPPVPKATGGRRRKDLERQAQELYPLIRSRLRAELIRDLERRGRLSREWR